MVLTPVAHFTTSHCTLLRAFSTCSNQARLPDVPKHFMKVGWGAAQDCNVAQLPSLPCTLRPCTRLEELVLESCVHNSMVPLQGLGSMTQLASLTLSGSLGISDALCAEISSLSQVCLRSHVNACQCRSTIVLGWCCERRGWLVHMTRPFACSTVLVIPECASRVCMG